MPTVSETPHSVDSAPQTAFAACRQSGTSALQDAVCPMDNGAVSKVVRGNATVMAGASKAQASLSFPQGSTAGVSEPAKGALVSRVLHSPARHRTCAKHSAHELTAAVPPDKPPAPISVA